VAYVFENFLLGLSVTPDGVDAGLTEFTADV